MEKIPEVFGSVDHYLLSYVYPLLEETRAALASSLETVYKAPFAEVVSLEEAKPTLLYNVRVDNWRNKISDRGKEPYKTLPGDLVLLSDFKPESASDLQRVGRTYTFASVVNISDDENGDDCTSSGFKLKTAGVVEVGVQKSKSLYVVYLTNITTHKRIWNALRKRQNLKIIQKVLVKNDMVRYSACLKALWNSEVIVPQDNLICREGFIVSGRHCI